MDPSTESKPRRPRGVRRRVWFYTIMLRPILMFLAGSRLFPVNKTGLENVPSRGPVILAPVHLANADPIYVWGGLRRPVVMIAKRDLWDWPVIGLIMRLLGHIGVDRKDKESGRRTIADGKAVLQHNGAVAIFPEGTCSKDEYLLPLRYGVANLATTGAPVIPVGVQGTQRVTPLGSRRVHRHPVAVTFGQPIYLADFDGDKTAFLEHLARRMAALSGQKLTDTLVKPSNPED